MPKVNCIYPALQPDSRFQGSRSGPRRPWVLWLWSSSCSTPIHRLWCNDDMESLLKLLGVYIYIESQRSCHITSYHCYSSLRPTPWLNIYIYSLETDMAAFAQGSKILEDLYGFVVRTPHQAASPRKFKWMNPPPVLGILCHETSAWNTAPFQPHFCDRHVARKGLSEMSRAMPEDLVQSPNWAWIVFQRFWHNDT